MFTRAAFDYLHQSLLTAELVRSFPRMLAPLIAKMVPRRDRAWNTVFDILRPIVKERLEKRYSIPASEKPVMDHLYLVFSADRGAD